MKDEMKSALIDKYRSMFVDRLTPRDLEELQMLLRGKINADRTINHKFLLKFEYKLRTFFHEEILTREMTSIEAVVESLRPEDLKRKA